jgi:hypothetical protein
MIYNRIIPVLILIVVLAFISCAKEDMKIFSRQPTKRADPSGLRFVVMQGQRQLQNGKFVPIVLRIDSSTGETWILAAGDTPKWESVQDNLQQVYKQDQKTKKWGLGIVLPDGRDINDLSKEELIRIVQSMSHTQQITNPNDPLGIRGDTTSGKQK